jgi:hypothetical protein
VTRDTRHTEADALRELRDAKERRATPVLVYDRIEHALELLAVDAVDDAVDMLSEALRLLEAEGQP